LDILEILSVAAFTVSDRIDAHDAQSGSFGELAAERNKALLVLAAPTAVTEEQEPARLARVVELRWDTGRFDPLLTHAATVRATALEC
jgi:hypothetical protein